MDEITSNQELSRNGIELPGHPGEPPAPKHGVKWVFVGKEGIRAGWGILLFIIVFILAVLALGALIHFLAPQMLKRGGGLTPSSGAVNEGMGVLSVLIATWVMSLIERKSVLAYGYQGRARGTRFISGLVWGFVAISALVFTLWSSGLLVFEGQALFGARLICKNAVEWAGVFLLVGISEESTLRGYLQYTMSRGVGFWWGALLFSFLFGFAHRGNPGESPVGLVSAGLIGLVFCLSLWYTGSLWWAVGFHAAWDWGQSYFYGTLDSGLAARGHLFSVHPAGKLILSGGKTGPEGSLYVLPEIALIALFMWLWWGRTEGSQFAGSGWRPAWSRKPRIADAETAEKAA